MSDQTTLADVVEEVDAVAKEAEAQMATEAEQAAIDATDLARQMAQDYKVDLTEVKGTGKDGRVTVPDIDKFVKARDEEAEAEEVKTEEVPEDAPVEKPVAEVEKPKPLKKQSVKAGELPNIFVGLEEIYHVVRSVDEMGMGWQSSKVSVADVDENLGKMLSEGWELIHSQPLGFSQDGIDILWVLGRFAEGKVERYPYHEIHHVVRRLGGLGEDGRGISGTAANALISGYLQSGWDLALVEALDKAAGGAVNMMWILIR